MKIRFLPSFLSLSISFFALSSLAALAQAQDSLVRFNELTFLSDFEKSVFLKLKKDPTQADVLSLLLASYPTASADMQASAESKIALTVNELKAKATNKSNAKNIKLIYSRVHDTYFRKYELENNFGEVFGNGNYNCLSASALYGLVLSRLGIPFSVKERPDHVYLVAFPATDKILIESTNPTGGYLQLNDAFMTAYLQNLMKAKMISKAEYDSGSKSDLFNKYYFSQEEDISLKKLAALQYYNLGIYDLGKEKHSEAFQHFAKARLLYPSTRINYLLQASLAELASRCEYDKVTDARYIVMLSRFNASGKELMDRKALSNEFIRLTNQQLINRGNQTLYDQTFSYLKHELEDTALLKDIEFVYNYESARIALNGGKTAGITGKLDRAYQMEPDNADVQAMITGYFFRYQLKSSNPQEILNTLDKQVKKYPFMARNENVSRISGSCYLDLAGQAFSKNNLSKGEEHLTAFEKIAAREELNVEEHYIVRAYIEASSAWFRAGNYAKSKAALNRGLKLVPDNFMLRERLSQIR